MNNIKITKLNRHSIISVDHVVSPNINAYPHVRVKTFSDEMDLKHFRKLVLDNYGCS